MVELTQVQVKNLLVFLERINLSAKEVTAYIEVVNVLKNALNAQQTEVDKK